MGKVLIWIVFVLQTRFRHVSYIIIITFFIFGRALLTKILFKTYPASNRLQMNLPCLIDYKDESAAKVG